MEGTPVEWSLKLVWALEPGGADEAGESLAMGSTTGSVWISDDAGDSWQTVSANLPPVYAVRFEKTM